MPLVLTSSGVEDCPVLDADQLDALATWLCEEFNYHDKLARFASTNGDYERFDAQCKANNGYCNDCRDFAGELLSKFTIRKRDSK